MSDGLAKESCIGDISLTLDRVVPGIGAARDVILCHDAAGQEHCALMDEWTQGSCAQPVRPTSAGQVGETVPETNPLVTRESPTGEKVRLFRSLFRGNDDVYAHGFHSKRTGKIGYVPACDNEWRRGVCDKGRGVRCDECPNRRFRPLTDEAMLNHFLDRDPSRKDVVGLYPLTADSTCWLLAADFDDDGWQEAAAAYRDAARSACVPCSVERSRSGNGAHVWIFFDEAVPAHDARRLGTLLLDDARRRCSKIGFGSYDRLFPTQDYVPKGGLGNLIALPLQGSAVQRGASVFVDDDFVAYPDQWAYLSGVEKVSASLLQSILDEGLQGYAYAGTRELGLPPTSADDGCRNPGVTSTTNHVDVTLGSMVTLNRRQLTQAAVVDVERFATIANPEFFRKQAMRQRVGVTPRYLWFGEEDNERVSLPRGCADDVRAFLDERSVAVDVHEARTDGRHLHVEFTGELRHDQQLAAEAMLAHDGGVLVAPTGFGKTVVAASMIAKRAVNTLVIVPKSSLVQQWRDSLGQFLSIRDEPQVMLTPTGRKSKRQPGPIGYLGGGRRLPSGLVDIALVSSLMEKGPVDGDRRVAGLVADYGMVIVDEAQHVPAHVTSEVLKAAPARYVYGLTATPRRKDGLDKVITMLLGPIRYRVTEGEEQHFERVLVPRFTGVASRLALSEEDAVAIGPAQDWNAAMTYISGHEERNARIVRDVSEVIVRGGSPLVLTRRISHARLLEKALGAQLPRGCRIVALVGSDDARIRAAKLQEVEGTPKDQPLCVVATGSYVGEGFDCPRLDTLLLAAPVSWDGLLTQFVGRIHRDYRGKHRVTVYDYIDENIPLFTRSWHGRLKTYARLGYRVAGDAADGPGTSSHIVTAADFLRGLDHDVQAARHSVVLSSEWVNAKRVAQFVSTLRDAVGRGVTVRLVVPGRVDSSADSTRMLEENGCEVLVEDVGKSVASYGVFDGSVVWFGSLPMLAYPHKDDCSVRIMSCELASELIARAETSAS